MVDIQGAAVVAVLTRAPSSGGKSRLFAALGRTPDPALLTALLLDTVDAARLPGIRRIVAVEPPHACDEIRALLRDVDVIPQSGGELGDRMAGVMRDLFTRGARAVALIGSDLPDLPSSRLADAFRALETDPDLVVIGPAVDGGYYLIAATRVPPLFDAVPWGTDRVLADTIALAGRRGVRLHQLERCADVDSVADLRGVRARRTNDWTRLNGLAQEEL